VSNDLRDATATDSQLESARPMTTIELSQLTEQDRKHKASEQASEPLRRRTRRQRLFLDAVLALVGVAFILPLLWLLDAAFNQNASQAMSWPSLTLSNFHSAVAAGAGGAIKNSLYLAVVSTIIATFVSILAAYALSRRRVPLKGLLLIGIIFLTGLPITLLLIPIYVMYVHLGWDNSPFYTSVALAATSVPFAIWLLKNFIDQVPREFEEAAAIEGSGNIRILWKVVIPLALPGICVAAILTFINSWGAFLLPLVIDANPQNTPGALGIYEFMSANGRVEFGPLAAYAILFSIPVIVLYLISTRWLHGGFAFAGGVKG
jgi:multiple sugar transport system permease protein